MNSYRRKKQSRHTQIGFTMVEVLVTIVLVSVAIVGTLGGIRSISQADIKANTADLLQRLAQEKMNDAAILASPTTNGVSGDFTDRGLPNVTWAITDDSTSVTNLDQVTVTVTQGKETQALTTLMFIRPATGTTTTAGANTSTGTAVP